MSVGTARRQSRDCDLLAPGKTHTAHISSSGSRRGFGQRTNGAAGNLLASITTLSLHLLHSWHQILMKSHKCCFCSVKHSLNRPLNSQLRRCRETSSERRKATGQSRISRRGKAYQGRQHTTYLRSSQALRQPTRSPGRCRAKPGGDRPQLQQGPGPSAGETEDGALSPPCGSFGNSHRVTRSSTRFAPLKLAALQDLKEPRQLS